MARKPVGGLFVWVHSHLAWSRLENYGRNRQRRPPYFLNSRLIKAADEFKKTTAINKLWQTDGSHRMTAATATQNSLPSDFILTYAAACEGQSLQGR
jgi:hypothetical protein